MPGRTTWTYASFCRKLVVLPGACVWSLDTYFNLLPIYHLYVLFVKISYQTRFCLQIYPAILFTMLMGFSTRGSYVLHVLLPGTSKACTLSVFMPGAGVHILLPGTQRYNKNISLKCKLVKISNVVAWWLTFKLCCRASWMHCARISVAWPKYSSDAVCSPCGRQI